MYRRDTCPLCGKPLEFLTGYPAHDNNMYCPDEKGCGYQRWNKNTHTPTTQQSKLEDK